MTNGKTTALTRQTFVGRVMSLIFNMQFRFVIAEMVAHFSIYCSRIFLVVIILTGPMTSWQIDGETVETVTDYSGAPKSLQMVTAAVKLKDACSLEEKLRPT